jgi:hypothetical protein
MRDKHEALVLSKPRIASGRIPLRYEGSNVWGPDYQNIGLLPFAQDPSYHDPDHDVIGKLPGCMVELLIADGFPLAGQPALSILNKQSELVQRIIESFEAHFQGSG